MDLPGVSAKKIYNSGNNAGGSAWVFLENVKVPVENLVGQENNGFPALMASKYIKPTLAHELDSLAQRQN
jgi:alkylation response protein AidB-like acyl-CoA dehydrogenase